jgi:AcrR family transcriptional regulator
MVLNTMGMETTTTARRRGRPPRAEQVASRRRALLDAAAMVFRRDGYLAATVDAIADAAGLTKGAVYSHFSSKADVFLSLLEERVAGRSAANLAAARNVVDRKSAESFLRKASKISREDPEWRLALVEFRAVAARDPELNERYARTHEQTIKGIGETFGAMYAALGVKPSLPLEALASTFLSLETGGLLEEAVNGHPVPVPHAIAVATRILGIPEEA